MMGNIGALVYKNVCACVRQLVFGGAGMQGTLGDLWLFNTGSRTWIAPVAEGQPPCPREMHSGSMVSDSRLLIYGGRSAAGQVCHCMPPPFPFAFPRRDQICMSHA